jgi:LCP family protein required for cell wall assembly
LFLGPDHRRSRSLAALLSFIFPGLGQAYRGNRRLASVFALPTAIVVLLLGAVFVAVGPVVFAVHLLNGLVSLGLLVVVVAVGVWRVAAIVDAAREGPPGPGSVIEAASARHRRRAAGALATLVILVVLSHSWLGYTLWAFYRAGQAIYEPPPVSAGPTHSALPSAGNSGTPQASAMPSPTPIPLPLPGVRERVTILFIGVDNTHEVDRGLTDSLIVATFDPNTKALVMISLPRDTARLPYYGGGIWEPRINSLMQAAARQPDLFPDGPLPTIVNEVSYIVGIPIDYYVRIDISGFTRLIDLVGGVDIVVNTEINDATYQFTPTEIGFHLLPGTYHMDGKTATAFARSRHGPGNSDFLRARRQQHLLLALRNKVDDPQVLLNLPALVDAVAQMVRTDAPVDRLPEIVSIIQSSTAADTRNVVLSPPHFAAVILSPTGERTLTYQLTMEAVAELSIELFGNDSRYATVPPS